MSRELIDLTGQRFGRWTVLRRAGNYGDYYIDGHTSPTWLCRCDCGAEGVVTGNNLRMCKSLSCGCAKKQAQQIRRARERKEKLIYV